MLFRSGQAPAGTGRDGESVLAGHPDAAHGGEQPLDRGPLGVVVQAGDALLGMGTFPADYTLKRTDITT